MAPILSCVTCLRLDRVNWKAVQATDFRALQVKDGKQAEFLVYDSFPWDLVGEIGAYNTQVARQVQQAIAGASHQPPVTITPEWYY